MMDHFIMKQKQYFALNIDQDENSVLIHKDGAKYSDYYAFYSKGNLLDVSIIKRFKVWSTFFYIAPAIIHMMKNFLTEKIFDNLLRKFLKR